MVVIVVKSSRVGRSTSKYHKPYKPLIRTTEIAAEIRCRLWDVYLNGRLEFTELEKRVMRWDDEYKRTHDQDEWDEITKDHLNYISTHASVSTQHLEVILQIIDDKFACLNALELEPSLS